MRLRQLARKLAVKPDEIVEFLALHHIPIEEESNTRLEDSHVELILMHFAPGEGVESVGELGEQEPEADVLSPAETERIEGEPFASTDLVPPPPEAEEKPEVIKAPKVELSGLKVLGKIELPEPKKKNTSPTLEILDNVDPLTEPEKKPLPESRKFIARKMVKNEPRPWKNPLEQQREREAREAEKKRQTEAERAKEQRTKNYFKKVKVSAPTKRVKLIEEQSMEMSDAELKEDPKTWLGRVFRWFRT